MAFISRVPVRRFRIWIDRLRGLDFLTNIRPEEVGLDASRVGKSTPSGNRYLANVLRAIQVTPEDSILDVGCGKGSAMRTMLQFPFARIDGLELSDAIAAITVRNFEKLKADRIRVFVGDAEQFDGYGDYSVIYIYNPFPASVMSRVVDALVESVRRSKRELIIIYNNAICDDLVVGSGVFRRVAVFPSEWCTGIAVYSNRDDGESRLACRRTSGQLGVSVSRNAL